MKELRQYQTIAIDKVAQKAARGMRKIIFQLATGGGKTVTFSGLINRYLIRQQKRCVILVHREELLKQARSTLYQWYEIVAAPVTADTTFLPQNSMVFVGMVETAYNRLKKNPKYFGNVGLVIVDECHIGNFKKLYDFFPGALIIGFTATPISGSKHDPLKNHFEDIVCGADIPELIRMGSLAKNVTWDVQSVKRSDLKMKNGDFDEHQMGDVFSQGKHVQNCYNAYKQYANGTKTIVFNCNIEHSKKVNQVFQAFGIPSRHLDGESDPAYRADTLAWFKRTPNAVLHNVGILTTGFDEPSVQTVIVNRATASLPLWLQMTGRGSRPFEGKEYFTIIDMGGNGTTHGDWCVSRDWEYLFFNPDRPGKTGEAPSKACVKCRALIHAGQKVCPYCGANNARSSRYDTEAIKIELLAAEKPLAIDVGSLVQQYDDGQMNQYYTLHVIKRMIVKHAKRVWGLKQLDPPTANKLTAEYQKRVGEWCRTTGKSYNKWHIDTTTAWFNSELSRVFKWNPAESNRA
jgi:superfamily II DNA or RNA helicase